MKYRTIVADPPWAYPDGHIRTAATGRSHNVKRDGARAVRGKDVRRSLPYESMTVGEMKLIPFYRIAEPDCRLFCWATNRYLPAAIRLVHDWGFEYRQTIVWHKAEGGPFPASIAPNTAEFLLVATIGKPERIGTLPSSVIRDGVPKRGGHSTKPECFLDYVEQVSPGPYLEMFARRARFGWDYWGDESLSTVEMSS